MFSTKKKRSDTVCERERAHLCIICGCWGHQSGCRWMQPGGAAASSTCVTVVKLFVARSTTVKTQSWGFLIDLCKIINDVHMSRSP